MITTAHIKGNGLVDLWDRSLGRKVELAPVDAAHALQIDPDNWSLEEPKEPEPESEEET